MTKIFLTAAFLIATQITQAQLYSNNGATLFVNNGAILQINGGVQFESGGTFTNNGTVTVNGNIVNNQVMSAANAGTLIFNSTAAQTLSGTAAFFAKDVVVNNANAVTLNTALKVDGVFSFTNGIVNAATTTNAVIFTTNASLSGTNTPNDASHVNGFVVKEGTGSFTFPVGDGTTYQKVDVNPTANATGIRVKYNATDAGAGTYTNTGTEATALVRYNALEHWDITPLTIATGTVTMYWDAYKNVGIANTAHLKVAHKVGTNWLNEGGVSTGAISAGSVTSNSISTWSPFTLGSINNLSALPLQWLSLTGTINASKQAVINFNVHENNVANYIIEKSIDGRAFFAIANLNSKGNSQNNYQYVEALVLEGVKYYRIKQIDNNGSFSYSSIVKLANNDKRIFSVYPNPTQNNININNVALGKTLTITDVKGKILQIQKIIANSFTLDISSYQSGVYFIKTNDGTNQKIIKQ